MYIALRNFLKNKFYHRPIVWNSLEFFQGLIYAYNYFLYYAWGRNLSSIREINIEFSSACNLRCKWCSLDHEKPKVYITEEILGRFFDCMLKDARFRRLEVINLHNGGETLLHPQRIEMLEVIKRYKELACRKNLPFPRVYLLTNAILLKNKIADAILKLGVVDTIQFSFDGGTPQKFEEMRSPAKWDMFYENVKSFCELNRKLGKGIKTKSITIIESDKPLNLEWMHPQFRELLEMTDSYELRRMHNWAGEVEIPGGVREKRHKIGCTMLMHQLVLLPNGDVTVCCSDLNSRGVIGNIMEQDLCSIYKSQKRIP